SSRIFRAARRASIARASRALIEALGDPGQNAQARFPCAGAATESVETAVVTAAARIIAAGALTIRLNAELLPMGEIRYPNYRQFPDSNSLHPITKNANEETLR